MSAVKYSEMTPVESGQALENLVAVHECVLAENKLLKAKLKAALEHIAELTAAEHLGCEDGGWPSRRAKLQVQYLNELREKKARQQLGLTV